MRLRFACTFAILVALVRAATAAPLPPKPDLVVAADGSGDFKSVHAAVQSIARSNRERRVILIKDGVYAEKVRVDAPFITLRGESRGGTRLEFGQARTESRDSLGVGVLNLGATANDFVLENLTVKNTHGVLGVHAFAVYGLADRTVIVDCDVLSQGNDTLSLWRGRTENDATVAASMSEASEGVWRDGGRYYHARLNIIGSVDFICPRGWCYMTDSTITQVNPSATAAIWHDGSNNADKKFVLRNCRFDGPPDWYLARRHHDGQFFLIDCTFSNTMRDRAPYRVTYPLDGGTPTAADIERNQHYDRTNVFGDRAYFHNSHRAGGDYAWHRDNLAKAPGAPKPEQVTAAWTFAGSWDPEKKTGPKITRVAYDEGRVELTFNEVVTVKGRPRLAQRDDDFADYVTGSGTRTLVFGAPAGDGGKRFSVDLNDGAIIATEAGATLRHADLTPPSTPNDSKR
jgi:pectinesterase